MMQLLDLRLKILLVTAIVLCSGICFGQERITKETKVILVVDNKSDVVEHIVLLANFQKTEEKQLMKNYGHHKFFLGLLKGSYHLNKNTIVPGKNTTVVIYTDKQFSPIEEFFQSENISPGDEFNLGETKAKVIANKKGELVIKTQKP